MTSGEVQVRCKEEVICCEGGEALEQAAQRSGECSSLAVFKARLDRALGDMVWCEVSLPMAEGLELDDLKVLSNPNHSVIL